VRLVKHPRWTQAEGIILGGFVIACTTYDTTYLATIICIASTEGIYVLIAGAILTTAAVFAASNKANL